MSSEEEKRDVSVKDEKTDVVVDSTELMNASGHVQEVDRNFGLLTLSGYGITNGNVWSVLGGTILVAIGNGGPPGTIYELYVTVSVPPLR